MKSTANLPMGPHTATSKRYANTALQRLEPYQQMPTTADAMEWTSPTSLRSRGRPSSLHQGTRQSTGYPLAGASPHARRNGSSGASSNSVTSPREPRTTRQARSFATRSTQTCPPNPDSDSSSMPINSLGDIKSMDIESVNLLIQALEERRFELLSGEGVGAAINTTPDPPKQFVQVSRRTLNGLFREDELKDDSNVIATTSAVSHGRLRSRSYEALVQLEQILEARHQQLMRDGTLESPELLSIDGVSGSDLTEEIRKIQRSIRKEASEGR